MLREIRQKVMQMANRLVKQGYIRANAMRTAWQLVKRKALSVKVAGTSFGNRQNMLQQVTRMPENAAACLVRDRKNAFDKNAVAVVAAVGEAAKAVIGYLPKAVACVVAVLLDNGLHVTVNRLCVTGGYGAYENYGARLILSLNEKDPITTQTKASDRA